jgi:hypothetical protein
MIGANLIADQRREGEKKKKTGRNRKREGMKRQKQEDGTTPTNLRV